LLGEEKRLMSLISQAIENPTSQPTPGAVMSSGT